MILGYNTNGLAHHDPVEGLRLLHGLGYGAVGLTLDHGLLNPLADDFPRQLDTWGALLDGLNLTPVIETGARFLLDPHEKHEPTLVSPTTQQRARRIDFLMRTIEAAERLEAEAVSLWSGVCRDGAGRDEAMDRLVEGLRPVLADAGERSVALAFEPEPGMLIATLAEYIELKQRLTDAGCDTRALCLTLDIGHLHCNGETPIADHIRSFADEIANVHIEDMRAGIHEHLMFGDGEIDFPPIIAALAEIGYDGPLCVELSRHSHMAPQAARAAFEFLEPLVSASNR
ncbi:L-ribulose-5-phosphate 3-epimerase UlaE [Pirellulimonas nuda]|uniref:L-ribulose-5-phosphate 3-epimerase UlaE n=1 Tax=Pirellulimonas nuda TaxID=2528009 RepID=A0A518DAY5_9BACT|nr:sugar phosphate isomerase/epimerase family protein [Pirellulimonas nuda]QDU88647.1 L-ribulose-5-phosphate 3-epimerase UlaE [Pirellulimonas nuda]